MHRTAFLTAATATLLAATAASAQTAPQSAPTTPPATGTTQPGTTRTTPATPRQTTPAQRPATPSVATQGTVEPGLPQGTVEPGLPAGTADPAAAPTTTVAQALPTLPAHATLNKLVAATDLGATLAGPGPFTVFAPTDEAFSRMPAGALDALLAPANKPSLTRILQYHVVPGKLTAEAIKAQITAGGGSAKLTTANGEQLTASLGPNGNIMLTDVNNVKSYVTQGDLQQTNGIVHVTNGVVFPKLG